MLHGYVYCLPLPAHEAELILADQPLLTGRIGAVRLADTSIFSSFKYILNALGIPVRNGRVMAQFETVHNAINSINGKIDMRPEQFIRMAGLSVCMALSPVVFAQSSVQVTETAIPEKWAPEQVDRGEAVSYFAPASDGLYRVTARAILRSGPGGMLKISSEELNETPAMPAVDCDQKYADWKIGGYRRMALDLHATCNLSLRKGKYYRLRAISTITKGSATVWVSDFKISRVADK